MTEPDPYPEVPEQPPAIVGVRCLECGRTWSSSTDSCADGPREDYTCAYCRSTNTTTYRLGSNR